MTSALRSITLCSKVNCSQRQNRSTHLYTAFIVRLLLFEDCGFEYLLVALQVPDVAEGDVSVTERTATVDLG